MLARLFMSPDRRAQPFAIAGILGIDPDHAALKRTLQEELEQGEQQLRELEEGNDDGRREPSRHDRRHTDKPNHPLRRASDLW